MRHKTLECCLRQSQKKSPANRFLTLKKIDAADVSQSTLYEGAETDGPPRTVEAAGLPVWCS